MKRIILFAASISLVLMLAMSSAADTITFELNFEYSGASEPAGPLPWLTATFKDLGTNSVELTMAATNLVGSEFVSGWYFNVDPKFNATFLVNEDDYDSGIKAESITGSNNGLKAGPASGFDLVFDFPTSNGKGGDLRFGAGDESVYVIEAKDLTAASFDFTNEGGNFLSAAHVQGIGPKGEDSGWIAARRTTDIPEAASLISLGLGILGIGLVARKKRLK
jgi:hypothetical protein